METIFTSEILSTIGVFVAGMLAVIIVQGLNALITSIRESGNKMDDVLLPMLEAVRDALVAINAAQEKK